MTQILIIGLAILKLPTNVSQFLVDIFFLQFYSGFCFLHLFWVANITVARVCYPIFVINISPSRILSSANGDELRKVCLEHTEPYRAGKTNLPF